MKSTDCRKKENKTRIQCKVKRFCNAKENNFLSVGKGIFALTNPTAGVAIGAYETGKAILKSGVCER